MKFRLIKDKKEWEEILSNIDETDIFYTYAFMDITKKLNDEICLLYYTEGSNYVVYPFYTRKISDLKFLKNSEAYIKYHDIFSAEHGGPIFHIEDRDTNKFIKNFFIQLGNFFHDNNIVAEFCRLNPFNKFKEELTSDRGGSIIKDTVIVDLTKDKAVLEREIHKERRKKIRHARNSGVIVKKEQNPKLFYEMYHRTMNRLDSTERFNYTLNFFEELNRQLKNNISFFFAYLEEKPIAAILLLHYGEYVHNFLSCSLKDYLNYHANDVLKYHGIMWARDNNFKGYNLGGGLKGNEDLFKYKSTFSSTTTPRCIYKKIFNKKIYDELTDLRRKLQKEDYNPSFFPAYRGEND